MKKLALYLLVGAALVGCGGDDSNSDFSDNDNDNLNVNLPAGFYTGTTVYGQEQESFEGLVDDDSRMWFTYSSDEEGLIGFVKSNDSVVLNNSKFNASGRNYSFDKKPPRNLTINGDYKISKTIEGKLIEQESTVTYNVGYDEVLSNRKQTLAMINNQIYTGNSYVSGISGSSATTVTFTTDGNFTGSDSEGCTIAGKLTPSVSERYFVSTVTFSGTSCDDVGYKVGEVHTGISVITDEDELIFLGTDNTKSIGVAFISDSRN